MEKSLKYELQNLLSGNESIGARSLIQTIAHYLRKSQNSSPEIKNSEFVKEQEKQVLIPFISQNNLWFSPPDTEKYLTEGAEQRVFLSDDAKFVIKINSLLFYASWVDYINNLILHNYFFPATHYDLLGFLLDDNNLYSVVKQPFVLADDTTNLDLVKEFLENNGFVNQRNNDYYNPNLGVILEDLHDENVLTANGILFFIDTVFYITDEFYK